ncbi:MAG: ribosome small subunit-dependent GTPase A, partial [Planctomycetota bacterium]
NVTRRAEEAEDDPQNERVSGKGRLTRRRTIAGAEVVLDAAGEHLLPDIDKSVCLPGVVLRVQGLVSTVRTADAREYACATRQLLKQVATDLRHVVAAGDHVWVRPASVDTGIEETGPGQLEGIIERVERRRGVLSRTSRGRQQLIAVNVDQALIVTSAAEPRIKPNLIDRYLITCERSDIRPLLCINKIDLVDPAELMPLIGCYAQMGYEVLPVSTLTGFGIDRVRTSLSGKQTVVTGQSGVGKSSLLNAINPDLQLRVQTVSGESQKGRHTTTTAELYPLDNAADSGFVVDTPGIRQFALWDVIPEEVAGYFRDIRPFVSHCRYPDCTHTHEDFCAVKDAVADGWINARRYESYLQIHAGDEV